MASQPKRTFADRKQAEKTGSRFTIVADSNLGPYKKGDTLSRDNDIALYFRFALNEGKEAETTLTDEQILKGVKSVNVADLDTDDAETARVAYLEGLTGELEDTSVSPLSAAVINSGDMRTVAAIKIGHMLDKETGEIVLGALDAKKTYDGTPLHLRYHLEEIFKDVTDEDGNPIMDTWPVIGTRRQDSKNDKPSNPTMSIEDWRRSNEPADYYMVETNKGKTPARWLEQMLAASSFGQDLAKKRDWLNSARTDNREFPADTPEYIRKLRSDDKANKTEAQSQWAEVDGDWRNMVNRFARAIAFYQQEKRIHACLKNVEVELLGTDHDEDGNVIPASLEKSYKRNKPIVLRHSVTRNPTDPISLTKFLSLKTWVKVKSIAELMDTVKRGTKKDTVVPAADQSKGGTVTAVHNVHALGDALFTAFEYLDAKERYGEIMKAIAKAEGGGLVASRIVGLYDQLRQFAEDASVRKIADAYDKRQADAQAAADDTNKAA